MPTIFRRAKPARRFVGARRFVLGSPIATTVGSAVGSASVNGVIIAIATAVGSTAGSSSVNGVGAGVIGVAGVSSGVATVAGFGSGYFTTVGTAFGAATVIGVKSLNQVVSTNILQKPIDYALAGEQDNFKRGRTPFADLRRIFRE